MAAEGWSPRQRLIAVPHRAQQQLEAHELVERFEAAEEEPRCVALL